jgi:anti-sigma B factor antagonist
MNALASQSPTPAQFLPTERVMTVRLEGEIGRAELDDIFDMIFRQAACGVTRLAMDLSAVSHFDYRGVKPLMARATVLRRTGGDLKLSGLSPYLFAIFRSAGANDAFDYFATSPEAVSAFSQARIGL